jgi:hypothetical protein
VATARIRLARKRKGDAMPIRKRSSITSMFLILSGALAAAVVLTAGPAGLAAAAQPVRRTVHPVAWGSPFLIDGPAQASGITAVSCASPKFCAAVDAQGNALTFGGVAWRLFSDVDSNSGGLWSVSCPAARFCLATDQDGFALGWNGRRWSAPRQFDFDPYQPSLPSVSCATAHFCAAVDQFGYALVWRGKGWSHKVINAPDGSVELQAISCLSTHFCLAVGNGFSVTWTGSKWSRPREIGDGLNVDAVSCTSTKFCVAGGQAGLLNYDGHGWRQTLDTSVAVSSVSCVSATDCFAATQLGMIYHWTKLRWKAGPDPVDSYIDLSCKTPSFCAGVTGSGQAIFYAPVPRVATGSLPSGTKGRHYSARLRAGGGTAPYRFKALAGVPRGLKVAADGTVSGTPKVSGHFVLKVAVTDPLRERSTREVKISIA